MEINGRRVKKIDYYWFDHCFLRGTGIDKHITDAINNHDWIQFTTYQEILNNMASEGQNNEKWIYLPDIVYVTFEDGEIEEVSLTKEIFEHIDANEYECG
jgi:hypothetical protein